MGDVRLTNTEVPHGNVRRHRRASAQPLPDFQWSDAADHEGGRWPDSAFQSRLMQWNKVNVHATYSMEEALALIDQAEPIF
jgi:hypothetical protein